MLKKILELFDDGLDNDVAPSASATPSLGKHFEGKVCVVRTYSAGVFYGLVEKLNGKEALVKDARRLWYWSGAASLSQLANEGVTKPEECKFPAKVPSVFLSEVVEVLPVRADALKNLDAVPVWKQ
jgi:hypothetical protein